jgi:hypothetical protein
VHKVKKGTRYTKLGKPKVYKDVVRKDCQDANNARNNDAFSITKANRFLKGENDAHDALDSNRSSNLNDTENLLIDMIDLANRKA